ncbi:MAG: hypothetical protein EBU46_12075 [Nitrosomonadaceae bacterium]|nr:hypothetical protein [Nitrosomonadaceae bacterium]
MLASNSGKFPQNCPKIAHCRTPVAPDGDGYRRPETGPQRTIMGASGVPRRVPGTPAGCGLLACRVWLRHAKPAELCGLSCFLLIHKLPVDNDKYLE